MSYTFFENGNSYSKSFNSHGISALQSMVANCLDKYASSLPSISFSLSLPFISSTCSYTESMHLYVAINFCAVTSPTPGTPGMLSEASPCKALSSTTCQGSIWYVSSNDSSVIILMSEMPFCVKYTCVVEEISCKESLSPVTILVGRSNLAANVPKISSASIPFFSITLIPIVCRICFSGCNCERNSSGIGFLVPLYSAYKEWRNVILPASNAIPKYLGWYSVITFVKIFKNP